MHRINLIAITLFCTVTACSPTPGPSSGTRPESAIQTAGQDKERPEITVDSILRDIVGRVVMISEVSGRGPPTDWTFEAAEFKQAEILGREATPTTAAITVIMTTRNNPGPDEDAVQVTGKLTLHYQRQDDKWVLMTIENLTFRYTVGVAT